MAIVVPLRDDRMAVEALRLAKVGCCVLPLWWPNEDGSCACGNPACPSPGKHPIGQIVPKGVKQSSRDPNKIINWWASYPNANIGVACGKESGVVMLDVDGQEGWDNLGWVLASYKETLTNEWVVETGRELGRHFWFAYPQGGVPTHKIPGLELRSDGAYVVAVPSTHYSGRTYKWTFPLNAPPPPLPESLRNFAIQKLKPSEAQLAPSTRISVNEEAQAPNSTLAPPPWSEAEEARVLDTIACIPMESRDNWFRVGAGLYWLGWGARGRQIWDFHSQSYPEKYNEADQQKTWESFGRKRPDGSPQYTWGTVVYLAKQHGHKTEVNNQIDEINKRFFMIRNFGGKCVIGEMKKSDLGTGCHLAVQTVDSFTQWFQNKSLKVNNKLFPLGKAWCLSKDRRQYEEVVLEPDKPEVVDGSLNLWRGFGVSPGHGDWRRIQDHMRYILAGGDYESYGYILRWTAWKLQNPGARSEVALVFRGGKGSGKGFFANAITSLFGEHALHIFTQYHVTGNFNGHLRSCLLLYVDEAFWAGDKKGESVLKGLITENVLMIEQKGVDAVQWRNRLGIIMTANSEWVVPASTDERRFMVFNTNDHFAQNSRTSTPTDRQAYFSDLDHEIGNGGLGAMLYDLQNWNLGGWHPRVIHETDALRDQKRASMSAVEQWFEAVLEDGILPGLRMPGNEHYATTRAFLEDFQRRAPHGARYAVGDKLIGDFLRRMDCRPARTNGIRSWEMRPLPQLRQEWQEKYGQRGWDLQEDWQ
jgi:hypothetical protein